MRQTVGAPSPTGEYGMNLAEELQSLTESFQKIAPAESIATIEAATARLTESGLAARALQPGQPIPDFELSDPTGQLVKSAALRQKGPLVISFYRGLWCPYCNLELKALQERLPEIAAKGATLVAISPQTPDNSLTTQEKIGLRFPVLSDPGNRVARTFGLVFTLDPSLQPIYESFGIDLASSNGEESRELPVPATYVVSRDGVVTGAFVNEDYRRRLSPDEILEWLDRAN